MPLRFPVETFFQSTGNVAAEFTENVRDGVATFACGLWANFPGFITDGVNPANAFARGFMNRACSPIQSPVPPPAVPFTGGQCFGIAYRVTATVFQDFGGGTTNTSGIVIQPVSGAIIFVGVTPRDNDPTKFMLRILSQQANGQVNVQGQNLSDSVIGGEVLSTVIFRLDGLPDDCGNPPGDYPQNSPGVNDLKDNITITVNDGLDLNLEIQYIKTSNQYNFPMNFKINGTNVLLDIGGIIIYAPDNYGSPSGGNDLPPPGSDPGTDGIGNPVTKTFDDQDYPVAPDSPIPRSALETVFYLACVDGVIEIVETTLQVAVGFNPILSLIIEMLGQILEDLCETPEASLGLPEYYGLSPGADRPAIVYLWKIFANNKWGASTYSSTVHYPTAQAIADIETLGNIEKTIGTFKTFLRLTDGSVIQATGSNESQSQQNFDFLINQVNSAFVPIDVAANTIKQEDARLQVKTLTLRQIEYYPDGKKDNVFPAIRRTIKPITS